MYIVWGMAFGGSLEFTLPYFMDWALEGVKCTVRDRLV